MASTKEYLTYVLDLLKNVDGITYKKMFNEFLLYKNNVLFGGIYDDRFLVKRVKCLESFNLPLQIPYKNAKEMYLIDIENTNEIENIINELYKCLKNNLSY